MKTVEYDSYAALTASYFASLPRTADLRRSYLPTCVFARLVHRVLGSNIADLSDAQYTRRAKAFDESSESERICDFSFRADTQQRSLKLIRTSYYGYILVDVTFYILRHILRLRSIKWDRKSSNYTMLARYQKDLSG